MDKKNEKKPNQLVLTSKNIDVDDAIGDYLGGESVLRAQLGEMYDNLTESRSAAKALFQRPLKDTEYSQPQMYKKDQLSSAEYRNRKLLSFREHYGLTGRLSDDHRILNNLSHHFKVHYKRLKKYASIK